MYWHVIVLLHLVWSWWEYNCLQFETVKNESIMAVFLCKYMYFFLNLRKKVITWYHFFLCRANSFSLVGYMYVPKIEHHLITLGMSSFHSKSFSQEWLKNTQNSLNFLFQSYPSHDFNRFLCDHNTKNINENNLVLTFSITTNPYRK